MVQKKAVGGMCIMDEFADDEFEELDYDPDLILRLSITWVIDGDWKLTEDRSKATHIICEDEINGGWYEIDVEAGRYDPITYH